MYVINSSTNCFVGGIQLPQGDFTLDFDGNITVLCEQGYTTNLLVRSGDTLAVTANNVQVVAGYDVYLLFLAGVYISVCVFGLGGFLRWIERKQKMFLGTGNL